MDAVYLAQVANKLKLIQATESTDASYVSKIPTKTKPSGDGIIDLTGPGNMSPLELFIAGIGQGADNATFNARILGWSQVQGDGNSKEEDLWIPFPLVELQFTLGGSVGLANTKVGASDRFADTVTVVKEPVVTADVTNQGTTKVMSPVGELIAWAKIKLEGFQLYSMIVDLGTATAADLLVAAR